MTPEQIEKVREHLRLAQRLLACDSDPDLGSVASRIASALAALNGEEEVWFAWKHGAAGAWVVSNGEPLDQNIIVYSVHENEVRRIAKLPALERAAREVVTADPQCRNRGAIDKLRAALTDKPEA